MRFTLRWMMVTVAILAACLQLDAWRRRQGYCRANAARCVAAERFHLWMAESHRAISLRYRRRAAEDEAGFLFHNEQAVRFTRAALEERTKARRAADRGEGFRRAARFPWLSIPEPEAGPIGSVPADREESPEATPSGWKSPAPAVRRFRGGT